MLLLICCKYNIEEVQEERQGVTSCTDFLRHIFTGAEIIMCIKEQI